MPPRIHGYAVAPCPACGGRLAIQRCPRCHRRQQVCRTCGSCRPLALDTTLRLAGAAQLPGFDGYERQRKK